MQVVVVHGKQQTDIEITSIFSRGFLKSDKVLGTVNMKLSSLENKCTVHESLDVSRLTVMQMIGSQELKRIRS